MVVRFGSQDVKLARAATLATVLTVATAAAGGQRPAAAPHASLLTPSLSGTDNFILYGAPCHSRDGKGGGPVAAALTTAPADLTRISLKNKGVFPGDRVRQFVTEGEGAAHGSSAMPAWGATFQSLDSSDTLVTVPIANIIAYLEIQQ
jgi:hypothetical protein